MLYDITQIMFHRGGIGMSYLQRFGMLKNLKFIGAVALVLSACGGSDTTSNRNGQLNSVKCFETQDQKNQAIADTEKQLQGVLSTTSTTRPAPIILSTISTPDVTALAPIIATLPPNADETSSTSTTSSASSPSPTTSASSAIVESPMVQQVRIYLDAAQNTPLCDATESSTAETIVPVVQMVDTNCDVNFRYDPGNNNLTVRACAAVTKMSFVNGNDSFEGPGSTIQFFMQGKKIEQYNMYIGDLVVAQGDYNLSDGDVTVTGFYQVAAPTTTEAAAVTTTVEATVDTGSTITCKAIVTSNGASFDCARPLSVYFFYYLAGGNESGSQWGNQETVFGPIENVRDIYLSISSGSVGVFTQFADPGTYEFEVSNVDPVVDPVVEPAVQEVDLPFWEGEYTPAALTGTFTISVLEGVEAWVDLFAPCDAQSISASITIGGESFDFRDMWWLHDGQCGVDFYSPEGLDAGDYEVSVNVDNLSNIGWQAQVESISLPSGNQHSPSDVTYTLVTQQVDAPQTFTIEVPAGGLWFTARGNTNQARTDDNVDPFLILVDDQSSAIAFDDDGGEADNNGRASFIETWLDEGTYYLVATTYDLQDPDYARVDALTQYELVYGLETSETITSQADLAEAVTPSADAPAIVLPATEYKLPVESIVVDGNTQTDSGVPLIPIGVTTMLCTNDCISTLFENAGVDAVSIELSAGGESVVVTRSSHKVRVPVARGATSITAIAKSADGAIVTELSSQVHQMSMNDVAMMSNTKSTTITPSASKSVGSQNNLLYVLAALVLISILAVINSRRKGAVSKG